MKPCYVLLDETNNYWWLEKGGFGTVNNGHKPKLFPTEQTAQEEADHLRAEYGFVLHPESFAAPVARRK